jgi:predicted HicB family RNase H-like nuclease
MPEQSKQAAAGQDLVRTGVRTSEHIKRLARGGAGHAGLELNAFVAKALAGSAQASELPPVPQSLMQEDLSHFNLRIPAGLWKQVNRAALDSDLDLQELVPRLLMMEGIRASEEYLAMVKQALAEEFDPSIKVSLPAQVVARARAAAALLGVEASEVLARALVEHSEGRLEAGEAPGGEYDRMPLDQATWRDLQAAAEDEGMEPGQLAAQVLEPYVMGVLKRHLEAALQPSGKKLQAVKGKIDFGRGWCPARS